jgi:hypothetical protein
MTSEERRERDRKYYAANPRGACERQRKYRAAHLEKARERDRKYRAAHPEKFREYHRKRYATPALREHDRKYRAAHREKDCVVRHKRRARKAGNGGSFTAAEFRMLGDRCLCCGKTREELAVLGRVLPPDHVISVKMSDSPTSIRISQQRRQHSTALSRRRRLQ